MTANRILLGQLISNGDCLYATAVASQIKHDFPGCHLTWAISSKCRSMIEHNPLVDAIWEVPLASWQDADLRTAWSSFEWEALEKYDAGEYDFVFFSQLYPGNPHHADGTVRPGIFLGYPGRITVDVRPSLVLTPGEVQEVFDFALRHRLTAYERVILFECSSKSGQSMLTPEIAYEVSRGIVSSRLERTAVILCSQFPVTAYAPGIIDGSHLSLRHMAELTKYCHLLIGGSSGISCISTSTWSKPLPMIQILSRGPAMFASLAHDYEYFGLPSDHVLEMFDFSLERVCSCYFTLVSQGWPTARARFHQRPDISFDYYLNFLRRYVLEPGDGYGVCLSLETTMKRYGRSRALRAFLHKFAAQHLGRRLRFASTESVLRKLKSHFRTQWGLADTDQGLSLAQYRQTPFPSVRPISCEPVLQRSEADYLALLNAQCPSQGTGPQGNTRLARALDRGEARKLLQEWQEKYPGHPVVAAGTALAFLAESSFAEAYEAFAALKSKMADGFSFEFERILCDLAWMCGRHEEALESCARCLRQHPEDHRQQRIAARLKQRLGAPASGGRPEHA